MTVDFVAIGMPSLGLMAMALCRVVSQMRLDPPSPRYGAAGRAKRLH
jgi:hypothetical protein